ncbi:4-alpha-glucanotransferase [Salinigranum salinum]|uniref:4-alpha-glucanotransferase n=1 Tax=Salinigranum salinum TaxID=1364937 RepID=UPI001260CA53|nr:4-alpha-glucanotransferase [Salinigranum salinum]
MTLERGSGLFLHIASLPGPQGIGSLGDPARRFVDFLSRADQSAWQFCPIGPTTVEYGNSPYSALSAAAGNPLFVDLADLRERGWLDDVDDAGVDADPDRVAYGRVTTHVERHLRQAHAGFETDATAAERRAFTAFREANADDWLDDYTLFRALKRDHDGVAWTEWPAEHRDRDPDALAAARADLADEIAFREFCQFCFAQQWDALRSYAHERGVSLVGDVPIYVAGDSADVWANRAVFQLDAEGRPTAVAGVPDAPDEVFSAQRWGMPLFDWDELERTGFEWWVGRLDRLFDRCDLVRIDHFRGLEQYWAIPADEPDPNVGEWRDVPSEAFFDRLEHEFGDLSTRAFAEDIGHLTDAVDELRGRYGLASLKLLPFVGWCDDDHPHMPHRWTDATVGYTSTHDSDTARGTYESLSPEERACLHDYVGVDAGGDPAIAETVHEVFVEAAWRSDASLVLAQLQDVLGLGSEARFNVPGTTEDNWAWRVRAAALTDERADWLADVTRAAGR